MIFNKKSIVFLLTVLYNITAQAQSEVLTLYKKDGTTVQYSFFDNPKILQQGDNLIMKTENIEVLYPFNDISKYTLNESKEEVDLYDIIIDNDKLQEYTNETSIEECDITYTRTFNDTHWQSFYVPFEVEPQELVDDFEFALINNFHQYDDDGDGLFDRVELEIKRCDLAKTLQANYPYLVRSKSIGTKEIKVLSSTLYATEEYSIDCSSVEFLYTFTGSYQSITNLGWSCVSHSLRHNQPTAKKPSVYINYEIKSAAKECKEWGMNSEVFVYNWDGVWEQSDILFLKNGYKYAINSRGVCTRNSTNPYRLGRTSFQEALPFEKVKSILKW